MKNYLTALLVIPVFLSGCEILPIDVVAQDPPGNFCPPGQAKKGNCSPNSGGAFCPPGQAKKGNC
jgi:hypothetical protein